MENLGGREPKSTGELLGEILDLGVSSMILDIYHSKHIQDPVAVSEATRLLIAINANGGMLKLSEEDQEAMRRIAHDVFPPRPPIQLRLD